MNEYYGRDQLRIIDVNANRAREGIRTAEDYIRFKVSDSRWAVKLKSIRNSVTQILGSLFSETDLVSGRNARFDSGHPEITGSAPVPKFEPDKSVAIRGLKRAQEAMRVLEEYVRGNWPEHSTKIGSLRFELYDAEQWLIGPSDALKTIYDSHVYVLITESLCRQSLMATAEAILKGGARVLQIREKECSDQAFVKKAQSLRELSQSFGAVLICNDRVDLAVSANLPGVHLGQDDLSPSQARKICGESVLIGRSTHSPEQAMHAVDVEKADYIAIGSMYETRTKQGRILAGLALAENVSALRLTVPVFAIGGISEERVKELKAAGVDRIAVSTAIIQSPDPEVSTRRLIAAMAN